jgi:hypothetical protein
VGGGAIVGEEAVEERGEDAPLRGASVEDEGFGEVVVDFDRLGTLQEKVKEPERDGGGQVELEEELINTTACKFSYKNVQCKVNLNWKIINTTACKFSNNKILCKVNLPSHL